MRSKHFGKLSSNQSIEKTLARDGRVCEEDENGVFWGVGRQA